MRIGILVGAKGRGSNMAALAEACQSGRLRAEVAIVVGPNGKAPAIARAEALGLPVQEVRYEPAESFGERLLAAFDGCDLICLAGFMRLVPNKVLERFPQAILNIHPALLPKFGGRGMYGHHVHAAVLASGETESGCTVHYVTQHYDEGPILYQRRCEVRPDDTVETLADRVLQLEHEAYVESVQRWIETHA